MEQIYIVECNNELCPLQKSRKSRKSINKQIATLDEEHNNSR